MLIETSKNGISLKYFHVSYLSQFQFSMSYNKEHAPDSTHLFNKSCVDCYLNLSSLHSFKFYILCHLSPKSCYFGTSKFPLFKPHFKIITKCAYKF